MAVGGPEGAGADAVLLRTAAILVLVVLTGLGAWSLRRARRPGPTRTASTQMSFLEHVEELRRRLLIAIVAWVVAMVAVFSFRLETTATGWPYPVPALQDNMAAQAFAIVAAKMVPDRVQLVVTRPIDGFLAELTIALGLGFLLAMPIILVQLARYFGPAMRPRERRALRSAVLPAMALFLAGAAFAWQWVLPFILATLYGYSTALGATPLLAVPDLIGFTVTMLIVFGLSFQLPLVMYVLARTGLVSAAGFVRRWRHAVVAILIFSAFVTDPTVVSQLMVAGPLLVLYFLGVLLARLGQRRGSADGSPAGVL